MPLIKYANEQFNGDNIWRINIQNPKDANSVISIHRHQSTLTRDEVDELRFDGVNGQQIPISDNDQHGAVATFRILLGLHRGQFAGIYLRWLYFFSGMLGTAMIATGLLLWVEKRRFKYENKQQPTKGYILVQYLNAGIIVGLPMAMAVYFLANRLLPVALEERSAWELNSLFITLGIGILYPFLRKPNRVWVEMLSVSAVLFFLVPIVNALTTEHHLMATALARDWSLFFVDATMLLLGTLFAVSAYTLHNLKKQKVKQPRHGASAKVTGKKQPLEPAAPPIVTRGGLTQKSTQS